ncbi:glycine/D-amino acid oxidase-like deaminating enzyme [Dyadobacter jejuensis]|uniref:Glycine/D-amino acid oxidase-like deaminating enzyme n=1 Tax=Dyadobacter jejuensis TaxID=1082580 RepID=A0A316AS02_9BACT|nr:FAD-dependent oxidoreductase [Dyadobacter jejuensis]PWJ60288.1 glycine/D-amino acid oxidase-like deaminating enzyme [Dyadobacter jejuensis]
MEDKGLNRRQLLKYGVQGAAATALGSLLPSGTIKAQTQNRSNAKSGKLVVIGAGAFGGWTALHLLRKGYDVTLVDQFGPGNNQASSGGETRLIRALYGEKQHYFDMVLRSLELWKENEAKMGKKILYQNGLMALYKNGNDPGLKASLPMYKKAGIDVEMLTPSEAGKRWTGVKTDDLEEVFFDPTAGFLKARQGCEAVRDLFVKEGGKFVQQQVKKENIKGGKATSILLADNTTIEADGFVFACGPWLVRLFPELTKKLIVTRQAAFFIASPAGASDLMENTLPTWFNRDKEFGAYGMPGCEYRGFKVAWDIRNDIITDKFDTYQRYVTLDEMDHAKKIVASRFPKLTGRPILEQRVCQYTETPDREFILDKHPGVDNLWVMGGGSGHGYKHGASFGEMAANTVNGDLAVNPIFALGRLL